MNGTGTLSVPNGNIYLLCIKKYDRSGNEIGSSSPNYSNGVLHYYINTKDVVINKREEAFLTTHTKQIKNRKADD